TIKIVLALTQYDQQLATASERDWIRMQVRAMADWWIEHHYTTRYFGNCCWWDRHEAAHSSSALLYLVRQAIAWTPGRTPRRLLDAWEYLMGHRRWVLTTRGGLNTHNLAIECLHRLDQLDPTHKRHWRRARNVLLDHTVSETNPHTGTNDVPGYGAYNTGMRTACSIAEAARWSSRKRHVAFAWELLRLYDREGKFFHHDQSHQPREHNQVTWWFDALSGHHYVAWLLAYWRLKNLP
ncbi:MAG: hypothetical protein HON70_18165, partial [Lentisphaerae bacterium]|nr:hypothetical protein [Lentisphaerota bacterium]